MREVSGLLMTYDEFKGIIEEITDGHASIANESGEWFYVSDEHIDCDEEMNKLLSEKFGKTVVNVILDLSNENEDVFIELKN